jgi:hypothetical protein
MATEQSRIELLIDTVQSGKNMAEVTRAAKALNKELAGVGVDPAQIAKGSAALAGLRDRLDNVRQTTAALDPDAKLQAYQKLGMGIVGTMGIATGALGLFGTKNEELNKVIERTNAIMAILGGVTAAQQALEAAGIIKNISLRTTEIAVIEGQTLATEELTVAQRIYNAVMSANPIFLIITAVVTIIGLYQIFKDKTDDLISSQNKLNLVLDSNNYLVGLYKNSLEELIYTQEQIFKVDENQIALFKKTLEDTKNQTENNYVYLYKLEKDFRAKKFKVLQENTQSEILLLESKKIVEQANLKELVKQTAIAKQEIGKGDDKADEEYVKKRSQRIEKEIELDGIERKLNIIKAKKNRDNQMDFDRQELLASKIFNLEKSKRQQALVDEATKSMEAQTDAAGVEGKKELDIRLKAIAERKAVEEALRDYLINSLENDIDKSLAIEQRRYSKDLDDISKFFTNKQITEDEYNRLNALALKIHKAELQKINDESDKAAEGKSEDTTDADNARRYKTLQSYIDTSAQYVQAYGSIIDAISTLEQQKLVANELQTKQHYDNLAYLENSRFSASQNALNSKYQSEFNAARGNATKQQQITDKFNAAVKKAEYDKTVYLNNLEYERAKAEYANALTRNAIAEKEFKRNKAFQIASAAINTAGGIMGAFATLGSNPTPAGIAIANGQAIAIGIAGAAQIAKIASTRFTPTDVGQPPVAPIVEPNITQSSTSNTADFNNGAITPAEFNTEFITTGRIKGQEFVKVYVLEQDITNVQNAVRAQVQNNTF